MPKRRVEQLELGAVMKPGPRWGGRRHGAGRKPVNPRARPNVPHRARAEHTARCPVHVTMRAGRGLPSFRKELVRNVLRAALVRQARRGYAVEFQVVHFSIQADHVHLIVEATPKGDGPAAAVGRGGAAPAVARDAARDALRRGVSGLAISFARRLNRALGRKGKVWADRHHRRDLESPTDVRNTLVYVFQNYRRHGVRAFGDGVVDPFSTATRFRGWADPHATIIETSQWPAPRERTWLLGVGWRRAGGLLSTSELPRRARSARGTRRGAPRAR